jgi:hypothetical protein
VLLLFAGRRPGTRDFPSANVDFVAEQITQLLAGLRPRRVVGSAAAGADLLVLEAAESLGIEAEVVIVGDRESFRAASVADKGEAWVRSYDHQLEAASVETLPTQATEDEGYRSVTRRIGERGAQLADKREAVAVLIVSAPRERGVDHSEELAQSVAGPKRLVLRIDPAKSRDDLPSAFVAMPFGAKPYPDRGWRRYEADLSYHRVMLPALIDGGYRPMRADTDALLEVIDHTMLREINRAKVMLVDLAMLNANVMWELGLRHAWRRSGTVLLAPEWVKAPFDIARIPVFSYRRTAQRIADADAVEAIRTLQRVLHAVDENDIDSPVFANINELPDVDLPEPPHASAASAGALLEACTLAGDLGDVERLLAVSEDVRASRELTDIARTALLEQIGLRLVGLDEYDKARVLLEPLAEADTEFARRRLQEQYAHVLIRAGDGTDVKRLKTAVSRLEALRKRHGDGSETLGLLGSAAKARIEAAVAAGKTPPATELARAIRAYRDGMDADPGDPYPGINAVALLRLRGQRWGGGEKDLAQARELLPVVRFAANRGAIADDVWARLTMAECALHAHLLDADEESLVEAQRLYADAAADAGPQQRTSARRQLRLLRDAGDKSKVIEPLLALFAS